MNGNPAKFSICTHGGHDDDGIAWCPLVHKWQFPIQTRSYCIACGLYMQLNSFNRQRMEAAQAYIHSGKVDIHKRYESWDYLESLAYENQREYAEHWHTTLELTDHIAALNMVKARTNRPYFFTQLSTKPRRTDIMYTFEDIDRSSVEPFDNGTLLDDISHDEMYPPNIPWLNRWSDDGESNI